MRQFMCAAFVVASGFGLMQACTKTAVDTAPPATSFDRRTMLTNMSTNIIVPAYSAFQTAAVSVDAAAVAFVASPDNTKLTTLQTAFLAAYKQWQATSAFDFGPAEQVNLRINTNTYPVDVAQVNANISAGTYNPNQLANLAAKGLPALDYLLFGAGADNSSLLLQYTSDGKAANRKTYLTALTSELKTNATTVATAWNTTYPATFINADGTDKGSSTGQLINQLVFDYEVLKNYEIGIPAGVQSMGTTYPQKVQAYYAKQSVQLALLHIQALQNFYLGKGTKGDGIGLDDYLTQANAKASDGSPLNDKIKNQFAIATARLQTLADPLSDQIKANSAAVMATYMELQKLTVLLKTDLTSALGILITYGDNDGD